MESLSSSAPTEQTNTDVSKDGGEGITVAVRVRPLNAKEQRSCWKTYPTFNAIAQVNSEGEAMSGTNAVFNVDQVFDDQASTKELYKSVCSKVVRSVVDGINGTVFAYGQTSSGKTHTMQGGGDAVGVLQLAAEEIFSLIEAQPEREFTLRVGYMEIYNEHMRDLLSSDGKGEVLIREDPVRGIIIQSREELIDSFEDIQQCLKRGEKHRTVGATAMNEQSSRSHAVFRLVIESHYQNEHGEVSVRTASLNLVDLAGSESVKYTKATGQRAKEGGNINKSLLTLSNVIKQLADGVGHVNFRDSKLTRLLQPMLLGNAAMAMICCVTPAEQFAEETRSTLQFATRAKNVRLNPEINEVLDKDSIMKKMKREIQELKDQLANANQQFESGEEKSASENMGQEERERLLNEVAIAQARVAKFTKMFFSEQEKDNCEIETGVDRSLAATCKPSRSKRHRETWCPGERGAAPLPEAYSGPLSPQPGPTMRRRLSESINDIHSVSNSQDSSLMNEFRIPALEAMLEKKSEELAESEAEKEAMYERLDQVEQDLKESEIRLANLSEETLNEIAELRLDNEEKDAKLNDFEKIIEEQKEMYAEMETDQLDLVKESKEKDAIIAELKINMKQLQDSVPSPEISEQQATKLVEAENKIKLLESQVAALTEQFESAKKAEQCLITDKEGLMEDLEDTQQQLQALKDSSAASVVEIDTLKASIESLKAIETKIADKDTTIEQLEAEIAEMTRKVSTLEVENNEKCQQVDSMIVTVSDLQEKAEHATRIEALLEKQETDHATEVEALSLELSNLTDQLMASNETVSSLQKNIEDMKVEAEAARSELVASVQSALANELVETKAELEECKLQMLNDVRLLEQSKSNENNLERASAEASRLRTDLTNRDVELKALRTKFEQLEGEHRVLRETTAAKLSAQHEDDTNATSKKCSQLTAQISILQAELNNATAKLTTAETQLSKNSSSHEKKVEKYEAELHSMALKVANGEELQFKLKGLESAISSAESRAKVSKEANEELQNKLKAACEEVDKLETEVADLKQKLEAHSGSGGVEAEMEQLRQDQTETLNTMRQLEGDKKSVEARFQKQKAEIEMLREEAFSVGELKAKVSELEELLESHDPEYVEKLEGSLRDAQIELNKVKEAMEVADIAAKKVIDELSKDCQAFDEQVMNLESSLENEKINNFNEQQKVKSLKEDIENVRTMMQQEIDSLKKEMAEKQAVASAAYSNDDITEAVQEAEMKLRQEFAMAQEEVDNMLKQKDDKIEALEKVKLTDEMKASFEEKYSKVVKKLEDAKVVIKQRDERIVVLEKSKMTQHIQDKIMQWKEQKDAAVLKAARLTTEIEDLRSRVVAQASSSESVGQSVLLKKQLDEARHHIDTLEKRVRAEADKAKHFKSENELAMHSVEILRVALRHEGKVGVSDLPDLSLDIVRKFNEASDAVAKVQLLEEQLAVLAEERSDVVKSRADVECNLDRIERERSELVTSLQEAQETIQTLEAKLSEAKFSQNKDYSDLEKQLTECSRRNKGLEEENLELMLENKDFKKQASAARCELEAMKMQMSKKSPGTLGLSHGSIPSKPAMKGTPQSYAPVENKENCVGNLSNFSTSTSKSAKTFNASVPTKSAGLQAPAEFTHPTKSLVNDDENAEGCQQS